jgi:hypothetical protein
MAAITKNKNFFKWPKLLYFKPECVPFKKPLSQKKLLPKIKKNNRNFRKIDARPSGIGYTFSSQILQCEGNYDYFFIWQ